MGYLCNEMNEKFKAYNKVQNSQLHLVCIHYSCIQMQYKRISA